MNYLSNYTRNKTTKRIGELHSLLFLLLPFYMPEHATMSLPKKNTRFTIVFKMSPAENSTDCSLKHRQSKQLGTLSKLCAEYGIFRSKLVDYWHVDARAPPTMMSGCALTAARNLARSDATWTKLAHGTDGTDDTDGTHVYTTDWIPTQLATCLPRQIKTFENITDVNIFEKRIVRNVNLSKCQYRTAAEHHTGQCK